MSRNTLPSGFRRLAGDGRWSFARSLVCCAVMFGLHCQSVVAAEKEPFGPAFPRLDSHATGEWWKPRGKMRARLLVPRDDVLAFAVYTHHRGVLKLTAQLFPLMPDEPRVVRLELRERQVWKEVARARVHELGWSAHFRLENWDNSRDVAYRVRFGPRASFEGLVRRDPSAKDVIVVGTLSCNSRRTPGPRARIVANLKRQDPDLLFFAGDQSYHHTQHTFGWLEWGMQFRDVLRDRPVVTIPDDHDIGQGNIWGEDGKQAASAAGPGGGYFYPARYVNMVQRCQTWHLPDAFDPTPVLRNIGVYYTSLCVGGIDFAILEDRKFKSGPKGKIPKMGPRPDHINNAKYDRSAIDLKGLKLLGQRQLNFLNNWSEDWTDTRMKCVLSQTAFCGAVHLHGSPKNRLLADLDCNGWPQAGRKAALRAIRRAWAPHICGDQHLAVVVKHGINGPSDGPYGFTCPAIVNTIYGRWWQPEPQRAGANPWSGSPLPWTGEFQDGLGNHLRMLAYANPLDRSDKLKRADGYGIVRFHKKTRTVTVECWPRFADVRKGDNSQFPGWPLSFVMKDNDGRKTTGWLPELHFPGADSAVVQVVDESTGEVLYTVRTASNRFRPPVYSPGPFTLKVGEDRPTAYRAKSLKPGPEDDQSKISIRF